MSNRNQKVTVKYIIGNKLKHRLASLVFKMYYNK